MFFLFFFRNWRDSSAVKSALLLFQKTWVQFPAFTLQALTSTCNSSSRESDILFWLPIHTSTHVSHTHTTTPINKHFLLTINHKASIKQLWPAITHVLQIFVYQIHWYTNYVTNYTNNFDGSGYNWIVLI